MSATDSTSHDYVNDQMAYRNSSTGISLTRAELNAYGKGHVRIEEADAVYFKPGFVDDDPWRALSG